MRYSILTLVCLATLGLSGCHGIHTYQPDVQQGNVVTADMVRQLRLGMDKQRVQGLIGLPVLADNFNPNHWAYTYTYQHRGRDITFKHLDLYFKDGRLISVKDGNETKQPV